jgi:hypothetical protein
MMNIFSFRKAVLPLLLLVQFAGTSAKGGDDGYQEYVDLHFNGKSAICDSCNYEKCSWTVIHNPKLDYNRGFWDTGHLKMLGPNMIYKMADGTPLQCEDSIIFAAHGANNLRPHKVFEMQMAKSFGLWHSKSFWHLHRDLYIDGVGDIDHLAARVISEGKLNKDCAILLHCCHSAEIGSALSRKINGWDPVTYMTRGVRAPDGGLMSKLILVHTQPKANWKTTWAYGSPVPGSSNSFKYNQPQNLSDKAARKLSDKAEAICKAPGGRWASTMKAGAKMMWSVGSRVALDVADRAFFAEPEDDHDLLFQGFSRYVIAPHLCKRYAELIMPEDKSRTLLRWGRDYRPFHYIEPEFPNQDGLGDADFFQIH